MKNIVATNVYWVLRYDITEENKYHRKEWFDDNGSIDEGWIYTTEQWMSPEEYFVFLLSADPGDYSSKYYKEVDDFIWLNAEEIYYQEVEEDGRFEYLNQFI